ncbi:hypothetical protein [Emticicia agri]|uniref:DUF1792 domain-containing protein n=1 Tax=Emticicia agri TaxID=2492393 RepID=A0A4Q5LVI2_9BACT|nr:hypothetical protein [Emticicia agri]RYU93718.1 hypothetical protein EWM59_20585 [Emticicia agri]
MNNVSIKILKATKRIYLQYLAKSSTMPIISREENPDIASEYIYRALMDDQPRMIARFGSTEMLCVLNYLGVKNPKKDIIAFIKGKARPWWWEDKTINQMYQWSGFFPPTIDKIEQFCELMLREISNVDILGSWLTDENSFEQELRNSYKVNLELLNPYFSKIPWTKALEGKNVLVVHPFAETIETQYQLREKLFDSNLLPAFNLKTIKAVQSIAGEKSSYSSWFEALDYMKTEINKHNYDICLIGCGAYGFPLAAHVKLMGKKGFHLGGSLQLLFGIRGKRWENENYNSIFNYAKLMNQYWVRPSILDKPENAIIVEGACYW